MFHRAEHGPALGITLFEPAKPALDFACVLESSAGHHAAQDAQRAVQTLESPEGGFYFGELHVLTPESVGRSFAVWRAFVVFWKFVGGIYRETPSPRGRRSRVCGPTP